MSEGVRTFTTDGQSVVRFDNKPIPAGEYELKLLTDKAEVKAAQGKAPRVNVGWEVLGTGKDGKKNRMIFTAFYTNLTPGSDGVPMTNRGGQVVDLANTLGERFNGSLTDYEVTDKSGNPEVVSGINALDLLQWLKSKSGTVVKARVKISPAKDGYDAKNDIAHFIPPDEQQASGLGEAFNGTSRRMTISDVPA